MTRAITGAGTSTSLSSLAHTDEAPRSAAASSSSSEPARKNTWSPPPSQRAMLFAYKAFVMHMALLAVSGGSSWAAQKGALARGEQNPVKLALMGGVPQVFIDAFLEPMLNSLGPNFKQPKAKNGERYSWPELWAKLSSAGLEAKAFFLTFLLLVAATKSVLGSALTSANANAAFMDYLRKHEDTLLGVVMTVAAMRWAYKMLSCLIVACMPSTTMEKKPWAPLNNEDFIAIAKGADPRNWVSLKRFKEADPKTVEAMVDVVLRGALILPLGTGAWPALMGLAAGGLEYVHARALNTAGGAVLRGLRPFAVDEAVRKIKAVPNQDIENSVEQLFDDVPHAYEHGESIRMPESARVAAASDGMEDVIQAADQNEESARSSLDAGEESRTPKSGSQEQMREPEVPPAWFQALVEPEASLPGARMARLHEAMLVKPPAKEDR